MDFNAGPVSIENIKLFLVKDYQCRNAFAGPVACEGIFLVGDLPFINTDGQGFTLP